MEIARRIDGEAAVHQLSHYISLPHRWAKDVFSS
jgi:hypothetical protein